MAMHKRDSGPSISRSSSQYHTAKTAIESRANPRQNSEIVSFSLQTSPPDRFHRVALPCLFAFALLSQNQSPNPSSRPSPLEPPQVPSSPRKSLVPRPNHVANHRRTSTPGNMLNTAGDNPSLTGVFARDNPRTWASPYCNRSTGTSLPSLTNQLLTTSRPMKTLKRSNDQNHK